MFDLYLLYFHPSIHPSISTLSRVLKACVSVCVIQVVQWSCPHTTWMKLTCWVTVWPSSLRVVCTAAALLSSWRTAWVLVSTSLWCGALKNSRPMSERRWDFYHLLQRVHKTSRLIRLLWFLQGQCDCTEDCSCKCSLCTKFKESTVEQPRVTERQMEGKKVNIACLYYISVIKLQIS